MSAPNNSSGAWYELANREGHARMAILGRLVRDYCCWQPPEKLVGRLTLLGDKLVNLTAQRLFLECCHPWSVLNRFPPPTEYRRRVLKAICNEAECGRQEIDDSLISELSLLLLQTDSEGPEASQWGYKTFFYGRKGTQDAYLLMTSTGAALASGGFITLRLSSNMLEGSTGCYQWEAGHLLGQYILSNTRLFEGRRCLELGCGSGLVGICLHLAGAAHVCLTDGDSGALQNAEHNLHINAEQGRWSTDFMQLHWGQPVQSSVQQPDMVVGADLLYDPGGIPDLVQTLTSLLLDSHDTHCPEAYLASCERNPTTMQRFFFEAASAGLRVEDVSSQTIDCSVEFLDLLEDFPSKLLLFRVLGAAHVRS